MKNNDIQQKKLTQGGAADYQNQNVISHLNSDINLENQVLLDKPDTRLNQEKDNNQKNEEQKRNLENQEDETILSKSEVKSSEVSPSNEKTIQEFKDLTEKFFNIDSFSQTDYDSLKEINGLGIRGLELPDRLVEMLYNENPLAFSTYYGNDEETKKFLGLNNPNMNGITPNEYMLNKTIHELTLTNDNYYYNILNCRCDDNDNVSNTQGGGMPTRGPGAENQEEEEVGDAENQGEVEAGEGEVGAAAAAATATATVDAGISSVGAEAGEGEVGEATVKNPNGMLAITILPNEAATIKRIKKANFDRDIIDPIRGKGYQNITFSDIIKYIYAQPEYVNDSAAYDGFIKNIMFGTDSETTKNTIPFLYITYTPSEKKQTYMVTTGPDGTRYVKDALNFSGTGVRPIEYETKNYLLSDISGDKTSKTTKEQIVNTFLFYVVIKTIRDAAEKAEYVNVPCNNNTYKPPITDEEYIILNKFLRYLSADIDLEIPRLDCIKKRRKNTKSVFEIIEGGRIPTFLFTPNFSTMNSEYSLSTVIIPSYFKEKEIFKIFNRVRVFSFWIDVTKETFNISSMNKLLNVITFLITKKKQLNLNTEFNVELYNTTVENKKNVDSSLYNNTPEPNQRNCFKKYNFDSEAINLNDVDYLEIDGISSHVGFKLEEGKKITDAEGNFVCGEEKLFNSENILNPEFIKTSKNLYFKNTRIKNYDAIDNTNDLKPHSLGSFFSQLVYCSTNLINNVSLDIAEFLNSDATITHSLKYIGNFSVDPDIPYGFEPDGVNVKESYHRVHAWLEYPKKTDNLPAAGNKTDNINLYIACRGSKTAEDWESINMYITSGEAYSTYRVQTLKEDLNNIMRKTHETIKDLLNAEIMDCVDFGRELRHDNGSNEQRIKIPKNKIVVQTYISGHSLGGFLSVCMANYTLSNNSLTRKFGILDTVQNDKIVFNPTAIPIIFNPFMDQQQSINNIIDNMPVVHIHRIRNFNNCNRLNNFLPVMGEVLNKENYLEDLASPYYCEHVQTDCRNIKGKITINEYSNCISRCDFLTGKNLINFSKSLQQFAKSGFKSYLLPIANFVISYTPMAEAARTLTNYVGSLTTLGGLGHSMNQFNGYYCLLYLYNILKSTVNNREGYKPFLHINSIPDGDGAEPIKQSFSYLQIIPNIDMNHINIINVKKEEPNYKESNKDILNYHKQIYGNTKIFELLPNDDTKEQLTDAKLVEIRGKFLKGIFQIENLTTLPQGNTDCNVNEKGEAFKEQQEGLPTYREFAIQNGVDIISNNLQNGVDNIYRFFDAIVPLSQLGPLTGSLVGGYKRKYKITIKKNKLNNKNKTRKH
jgi:hypothetical protein